ncbi:MAG TPA: efflux RND transporter periplasmic adaptor subunit, partial [Chthonomonadales bacterium]|nr:efflux RND transporter periplasmic adaptor subunit [Chthonomonadales bacterium]
QSTNPQAVVAAKAAYDQAAAQTINARRNWQRQKQLLAKGYVAQQVTDSAETDYMVAEAHQKDMKERLDRVGQANEISAENARSQVAAAAGAVDQARAALQQAQNSDLPLTKQEDLANARAGYRQSKAQLASAESSRAQDLERKAEVAAATADTKQIQNQLQQELVHLGYLSLYAPMDGVVTHKYVEVGEVVMSGISGFGSGTPIYQISNLKSMVVKIDVNEVDIEKVRLGMPTDVVIDAAGGATFQGHVRQIAPAALATASSSGSSSTAGSPGSPDGVIRFPVEIQVDTADVRMMPGMSARCSIIIARRKDVLRLPTNCVSGDGANATVQVVNPAAKPGKTVETVTTHKVVAGLRGDDFVEVKSGLSEGEQVRPFPYNGPPRKAIDIQTGG